MGNFRIMKKLGIIFLLLFIWPSSAEAGDYYWVDSDDGTVNVTTITAVGYQVLVDSDTKFNYDVTFSSNISIPATYKYYVDGGSDTYHSESAANKLSFFTGGTERLRLESGSAIFINNTNIQLEPTEPIIFDGSDGHTKIAESSDDVLDITVGNANIIKITESTTDQVDINGAALTIDNTEKLYWDGGGNSYTYESSADVISTYVNGVERWQIGATNGNVSNHQLIPAVDNGAYLGIDSNRWAAVWAVNGTIQTSCSESKEGIIPIVEDIDIPPAIKFKRKGQTNSQKQIGFLADELPEECFAINTDGTRSVEDIYLSAVVGLLCNKVKHLEERIEKLEKEK